MIGNTMTTSEVIALGLGIAGLMVSIAAVFLHTHGVPKEKVRIAWVMVAVAALAAGGTLGYAVRSKASITKQSAASEVATMVGYWSGSYTVDGVTFGLAMNITDVGGDRLQADINFSMSATLGLLSDSDTMIRVTRKVVSPGQPRAGVMRPDPGL
jgi:hypothetical protein